MTSKAKKLRVDQVDRFVRGFSSYVRKRQLAVGDQRFQAHVPIFSRKMAVAGQELKEALDFVSGILRSGMLAGSCGGRRKCKVRSKVRSTVKSAGRLVYYSNIRNFGNIKVGSKVMYFHICHNVTNGRNYVNVTREQPSSEIIEVFELNKLLLLDSVSRFFKLRVNLTLGA
jgi:hypothetical protein